MVKPPVSPGAAGKLAQRTNEGVLERARRWLVPVYERYRKNTLTHGEDYLRGDPEIPISLEVEDWRAIPSLDHISLSRATLTATDSGGILLQGRYGGPLTAAQMLTGSALTEKPENAIGAGVCGMGSTGRWPWELSQHHWLELDLRTDGRPYEHPGVLREPPWQRHSSPALASRGRASPASWPRHALGQSRWASRGLPTHPATPPGATHHPRLPGPRWEARRRGAARGADGLGVPSRTAPAAAHHAAAHHAGSCSSARRASRGRSGCGAPPSRRGHGRPSAPPPSGRTPCSASHRTPRPRRRREPAPP